jgi:ribonucleoside-diphosphate reductase alpha chain
MPVRYYWYQMTSLNSEMHVTKRSGELETVSFDKILNRVKKLSGEVSPPLSINFTQLVMKVIDQLYDGIPTTVIDELTAEQCAAMNTRHPDYGTLASRIVVSNHVRNTPDSFSKAMEELWSFEDANGAPSPLVSSELRGIVEEHGEHLNALVDYSRDYLIDYFGFKTLERAYLMRVDGRVVERPQHMWLRVSIGIHGSDLEAVEQTYTLMSQKFFTHATPTLFNAGTPRPQLSSCYLVAMESDSIDGIYNTLHECARISKFAGGVGMHVHNVRAEGSHIRGTNGTSNGLVPMLRVFNMTARYVDQGGGKRNGSIAVYIEPWHADIENFLDLKKNHGDEDMRARDLFYALWIPSAFMRAVRDNADWHLFCPDACGDLADCYGADFDNRYADYVCRGKHSRVIKARDLWVKICDSQMETGTPYILYKDTANAKSNQQNLGVIKSSNLCCEIMEYSDAEQTAVCNLASIGLPMFVEDGSFNHERLHAVTKVVAANLDRVIDVNFYPTEKTRLSNLLHRPVGIGVQGLADVFAMMNMAYESQEARRLNRDIFETIYHAALEQSNEIASRRCEELSAVRDAHARRVDDGNPYGIFRNGDRTCREYVGLTEDLVTIARRLKPLREELERDDVAVIGAYSTFRGSPASRGTLQFDMWNVDPSNHGSRYDWSELKDAIKRRGLRNSLSVAPMPTASTSQILGNNECFEPYTSNIYTRRTIAGDFLQVNKHLMREMIALGVWSEEVKNSIIENKGSIQHITGISDDMKARYKIVWEMSMRNLIDMAADRGAYICQSQSLNLWLEDPDYKSLTSMHFHSWQSGLKTGIYYLRRKPKHQPQQFTIAPPSEGPCETCSA